MTTFPDKPKYTYDDLVAILRILRGPDGCPWDRVQTHASDRRNFLEEAYEAAEAFDRDDPDAMCEELGDVLLQVLFNIHIEEDAGRFTTDDVTDRIVRKLIYRHPHVFSNARAENADEVMVNWERLKRAEKGQQTVADTLDAVARSLPARWRADKLLGRAGLNTPDAVVPNKLADAVAALKAASDAAEAAEVALYRACDDFIARYRSMEEEA